MQQQCVSFRHGRVVVFCWFDLPLNKLNKKNQNWKCSFQKQFYKKVVPGIEPGSPEGLIKSKSDVMTTTLYNQTVNCKLLTLTPFLDTNLKCN